MDKEAKNTIRKYPCFPRRFVHSFLHHKLLTFDIFCSVVEVYKETSGPDDGSPNYSCPSQRRPHQHIDDVNTMLEGVLDKDKEKSPDYLTLKYKRTKPWGYYDDVHGLYLTCWIMKINENIVDSDVYKDPNEGGVQNYDYDKDRPFASFCFRIILRNKNEFLPYHTIDAAEDRDGGRYLQDTAETPDTGDSLGIPPPPPPVYDEAPEDNMDITYCDTGITIYFDLKADFWVRGFKTQARRWILDCFVLFLFRLPLWSWRSIKNHLTRVLLPPLFNFGRQ